MASTDTGSADIAVRRATAADFAAVERIAAAHGEATTAPGWPGYLYLEFVATAGTLLVAELGGAVSAYAGAMVAGGKRPAAHITDLFVEPSSIGRGVGGRLVRELMLAVDVTDWTVCSSSDPRALTLYTKAGMSPSFPILYVDAPLDIDLVERRQDVVVSALAAAEAAAVERAWSGRDFGVHYEHWIERPGGVAFRVELAGRIAAVGAVRAGRSGLGRVIDHVAMAPSAEPAATMLAALSSGLVRGEGSVSPDPAARIKLAIPGPNPVLPHLLGLGFRIDDHDTFCATDPALVDPLRFVPDPSFG